VPRLRVTHIIFKQAFIRGYSRPFAVPMKAFRLYKLNRS
jgi:hypothetical protein